MGKDESTLERVRRVAEGLADVFADRDPLETMLALRMAAQLIEDRAGRKEDADELEDGDAAAAEANDRSPLGVASGSRRRRSAGED